MLWTMQQHNFAGGRLDKELMGRQDLQQYFKGCSELHNFTITRQGNLSKRRGTDYVCTLGGGPDTPYRIVPIVFDRDDGYYALVTGGRAYILGRRGVWNGTGWQQALEGGYSVDVGISDAQLEGFDYVQSGDTLFVVSRDFKPFTLVFDRERMTLERVEPPFDSVSETPPTILAGVLSNVSGGGGSRTVRYRVTYVSEDGVESLPSAAFSVKYTAPWKEGGKITIYVADDGSTQDKASKYNVYKEIGGGFGFIGSIAKEDIADSGKVPSSAVEHRNIGSFDDVYITPDMSMNPPSAESRRTFSNPDEWPNVVSLYQQRLVFGSSRKDPFTFWMSCVGDIYNFSTHETLREDDAITATLAATEMPDINHALLAKELMLFTDSGEWEIAPVSGNTMSYKTVSAKMQSSIGSSRRNKPLLIGDEIVFVDASGERMLSTRYNFATDGYESQELTVLSQWLFRNNEIRRIAYRKNPDSHIHCVMGDGTISVMVYMREHEVCAWTRYELGGGYAAVDVATAKNESNGCTEVVYIVRSPDGVNEVWRERDIVPYRSVNRIEDFVCMDGVRRTEVQPGATFAGRKAVDVSDGTVLDGAGDGKARTVVVGWTYMSKFESVSPDTKGDGETMQMEIQNATEAKVRVIDSSTFKVGACSLPERRDTLVKVENSFSDGTIRLGDRDARVVLVGDNAKSGRVRITHDGVLPLNILSLATTYQVEPANRNGGGE